MALGGAERYIIDLANSLVERGIKVTMAYEGPVLHKLGPVDEIRHLEIKLCRRLGKLGVFRPFFDWPLGFRFYNYIRKADVDIVNTVMMDTGMWSWLAARFLGVPIVLKPMHVFSNYSGYERFLIGTRFGVNIVKFLRLNFLPGSDYAAWELTNIVGVPPKRVYIARMGVDLHKFRPKAADNRIRKELGLVPGPVIGSIGRLYRVKGCHKIISAMPAILRVCPETQLLIVGDGSEREALERQAKELQVLDNVIFAGWRTDTVEMTALLDVYVQTTDGPSLGISVLQALAQAKPLVVFAADELEKKMAAGAVQDGVNGHIVPTNEPDKAGETIGRMLADSRRLKEMGLASRKLAEEKFDWDLHVSKVVEVYEKLICNS
jgi:glycosyltransferase involved in cell wall biosynthesis